MNVVFWDKIRRNHIVRMLLLPLIRVKRKIEFREYQGSEDAQFIKTLKNSCNGKRCFIIGNGPSLTREDLDLLVNGISEEVSQGFSVAESVTVCTFELAFYMGCREIFCQEYLSIPAVLPIF